MMVRSWVHAARPDMLPDMKSIYSPAYRSLLGWLRASRIERQLSMREVGKRMGLPHTWVGKVETGERRLDVEEFVGLCEALGVIPEQGIAVIRASRLQYPAHAANPLAKVAERTAPSGRHK